MWTARVHNPRAGATPVTDGSDFPGQDAVVWRPHPALLIVGGLAALGSVASAVLSSDPLDRLVAVFLAVVFTAATVVGRRRRVVGGPRGLLVQRFSGTRIVPWSQVRSVHSARSARLGIANTTVEIDLTDDDLLVFGRTELGTDPADVADVLARWWRG